jgi:hypothetical protein
LETEFVQDFEKKPINAFSLRDEFLSKKGWSGAWEFLSVNNLIDGLRKAAGKVRSDADLQSARAKFNGVMDDLKDALLLTNRPIVPHLTKSFDDWNEFRFNSLCVVDVERHGNELLLTLETDDVLATQRGLAKYRKRWESSCRNWYGCVVQVKLMKSERK